MRLIACLILSAVPLICGFTLASGELCRVRELEGFVKLISHIRYELSAFLTKQSELFLYFECPALEESGFLDALRAASARGAGALYETLTQNASLVHLGGEDLRVLQEYAAHLGEYDAEEELLRAEKTETILSESLKAREGEYYNRVRLYRAFGIVLSLMVLLLIV